MSSGYDLLKGLKVTFKELFKKSVTDKYPKEFRDKAQRFHGRHVLNKYEDGMEKCIGCELCAGACPAQCIYVRGEDNPEENPVSPGERYGFIYEININIQRTLPKTYSLTSWLRQRSARCIWNSIGPVS